MDLTQLYSHTAMVLPVQNLDETLKFYLNKLDFIISFEWGNPVYYMVGKLGDKTAIHSTQCNQPVKSNTSLYVFVHDVDAVYEILTNRNVSIINPIGNRESRKRDFDIFDNNGIKITFATSLEQSK